MVSGLLPWDIECRHRLMEAISGILLYLILITDQTGWRWYAVRGSTYSHLPASLHYITHGYIPHHLDRRRLNLIHGVARGVVDDLAASTPICAKATASVPPTAGRALTLCHSERTGV